ncbi:MAG TPA: TlpA disulfide reductase family protein [Dehalococcoidia bacterium]|nr:TlpA disulfide reductase family protein [Dehalococcoidia bacterium]
MTMHSGRERRADAEGPDSPRPAGFRFWRQVALPLLAIATIVAVIWWLENHQQEAGTSASGAKYGPVDLPPTLAPAGLDIGPEDGKLAPDFLLESLDGQEVRLSGLRGKAVVINFWATWCKPCRQEIPQLIAAYNRYRGDGLEILGVNLQEAKSIIKPFAEDYGMNFPIPIDRTGAVANEYRLLGVPTTYFIDRQGIVRSAFTGPFLEVSQGTNVQNAIEEDELTKRIEEILQ